MKPIRIDKQQLERLDPVEREQVLGELKAIDELRKVDPLQFFTPHAKQRILMEQTTAAVRAFLGGNRSGKTTVGIVDDIVQAIDRNVVPEHLLPYKRWEPPFYCRIITPDFTSTMEGVVFQKLREWSPRSQLVGGSWSKSYDKQNRMLRWKNGSWFQFMTFEQDLDKFGGAALHRIHYDEEPPEQIRKECLMRLIDFAGEELFTMTPLLGMTWMYSEIWEAWEKDRLEEGFVVTVDMDDNPYLDEKTKRRVLGAYTSEERQARKEGKFVHFGGLIFGEFRREEHIVPKRPPAKDSFTYVGIDPGQRHMAAVVFVEVTSAGEMCVYDEIALQGATVRDVCEEIRRRLAYWDVNPRMYVIDPSARNHHHQTGRSDQVEYMEHGIPTVPGQNAVRPGINRIKERLQSGALTITDNCPVLVEQFVKYRWATPKKSSEDPAEKPVKQHDHLLDALRYVCMALPQGPARQEKRPEQPLWRRLVEDELASLRRRRPHIPISQSGPGRFA